MNNLDPIWYPFTQMSEYEQTPPLTIEKAQGHFLIDEQGKHYLDGVSSLWTNVHGHCHPKLDQAITHQLAKVAHSTLLGQSNTTTKAFAIKLMEKAPKGLTRLFFSDNGSTAVEVALKMAFQYYSSKGKKDFFSMSQSYHGDTIGSVSVGGIDLFHKTYKDLLFQGVKIPAPHCYRCPFQQDKSSCQRECEKALEQLFEEHHHHTAAIIIEPLVQGAGGMIKHPHGYLKKVRELCDRYDVLMIADEVAVGFGKTGTLFACEQEEVVPDMMALAKGISGGVLPLAATLVKEKIYQAFLGRYEEMKTFFHGHTFTGNALACAVAQASLELFDETDLLAKVCEKSQKMGETLKEFYQLKHVGDIRQCGLIVGIELVQNRSTKESFPFEQRVGHQVILEARKRGVLLRPLGDVIVLMPPLSIKETELQMLLDVTYQSIKSVTESEGGQKVRK